MFKQIEVRLIGVVPMLMHNGMMADPLGAYAKEAGAISKKRNKTEDDHRKLAELEFIHGLYMDGDDYIIPGENLEAMLGRVSFGVAKISKEKTMSAVEIAEPFVLTDFTGPKEPMKRAKDANCFDRRMVTVGGSRIARTRPKFQRWVAEGTISYLPSIYDEAMLLNVLETAGRIKGINDYSPKFGRFEVEVISEKAV